MNRREFIKLPVSLLLPKESVAADIIRIKIHQAEQDAALLNQGEASFMRDQKLLDLVMALMGEDKSVFTYYGEVIKLVAESK